MTPSRRAHSGRSLRLIATTAAMVALLCSLVATDAGASTASKKAAARKLLLVLPDLPKGWSKQKGSSNGGGPGNLPGSKQLASCIGVPANLIHSNEPTVDSPTYQNKGDSLEVDDSVSIFSSAKVARAELAAMGNARTPGCGATLMNGPAFRKAMLAGAGKGATIGTITGSAINPANFPAGSVGLVLSIPISVQGESLTISFTVVYYVKGALGQQIQFTSYGVAFPPTLANTLTALAEHRL